VTCSRRSASGWAFLVSVGLTTLTLERAAPTLSAGRPTHPAGQPDGSGLVGVMYILASRRSGAPPGTTASCGHPAAAGDLATPSSSSSTDYGDHAPADWIVDFGPGGGDARRAGRRGRPAGPGDAVRHADGQYLGRDALISPSRTRHLLNGKHLVLEGARHNNLKDITVRFPLRTLICITASSGSASPRSSTETLYPALPSGCTGAPRQAGPVPRPARPGVCGTRLSRRSAANRADPALQPGHLRGAL